MAEWNKTQERFLQKLGENAKSWDWLHQRSSLNLTWWNRCLSILNVFFNALLTALTTTNLWGNPILFNFVVLFVSIISFSMVGILKTLNYIEKIESHRTAAQKFKGFANDIQAIVALRQKDRGNAEEIVKEYSKKFNDLLIDCPNVEEKIIFNFTKIFKQQDFSKPELANEISGIEIKEESSNNSPSTLKADCSVALDIDTSLQDDLEKALEGTN